MEFLIVGGLIFWIIFAVMALAIVLPSKDELGWWNFFILLAGLGAFQLFTKFKIFSFIWLHIAAVPYVLIGYLVIGAIWSVLKWYTLVKDKFKLYNEVRAKFFKDNKISASVLPPIHADNFSRALANEGVLKTWYRGAGDELTIDKIAPKPSENKSRILYWIGWWPLSVVGTIVGDYLLRVVNHIYDLFVTVYERISHSVFGSINLEELNQKPEKVEKNEIRGFSGFSGVSGVSAERRNVE